MTFVLTKTQWFKTARTVYTTVHTALLKFCDNFETQYCLLQTFTLQLPINHIGYIFILLMNC